jgi:type II secretory pathway component GspD/PulD (secretin)
MKKQNLIGLILLTAFCVAPVFAQADTSSEEKLYTEFVKLKNVPENKVSNEVDKRYIIFRRLIDSIKIYLTPKGEIEIDVRSRTIIITDIKSNIEFMKDVVTTYDYEEIYLPENEEDTKVVCSGFVPKL